MIARRVFLFLVVNFLVVVMISLVINLLNLKPFLSSYGIDYFSLFIFSLIWGMGGAFISLLLSKKIAKMLMGVKIIDPKSEDVELKILIKMVEKLSQNAHLPEVPEIGIYSSNEVNAFATGPSKKRSLIAVSTGLLKRMKENEIEAILGHEISHIANGDMVTMTLLQGVVNVFVIFLARILAFVVTGINKNNKSSSSFFSYMIFVFLFEVVFMVLGSLVVAAFSRYREYRADSGGAYLSGKENMISALQSLRSFQQIKDTKAQNPSMQALKISTPSKLGLLRFFATHPPLKERIEKLQQTRVSL